MWVTLISKQVPCVIIEFAVWLPEWDIRNNPGETRFGSWASLMSVTVELDWALRMARLWMSALELDIERLLNCRDDLSTVEWCVKEMLRSIELPNRKSGSTKPVLNPKSLVIMNNSRKNPAEIVNCCRYWRYQGQGTGM